jgi:pyruvate,water dikinase
MLTVPSYQENPTALLDVLRAYAALEGDSPDDVLKRQQQERLTDTERVLQELRTRRLFWWLPGVSRALLVKRLLGWTHRAIAYRERARLKQALLYSRCRRIALAIGAKLAALGTLPTAADVFFLTYSEIDALVAGNAMFPHTVGELVRLRKTAHADLSAMRPPDSFELAAGAYLPLSESTGADAPPDNHEDAHEAMRGVGACGGQATGPAAVLQDVSEFGRLHRGDILVTRQTDPGWGPVFFLIKGLIMERGGMLSHGAILAREYGIPTVVGVRDATHRIPTGQIVSINGDRGLVQFAP